jgi:DNA-3-methyladenine glycosylase I
MRRRCGWARDPLDIRHHDEEWGVPERDDRRLFEFLILESAQAGLSWLTILRKRESYRRAFAGFDPATVACFSKIDVRRLLNDDGIVRNRAKIEAAIADARAVCAIQREYGSFATYVWRFVGGTPIQNAWRSVREVPAETEVSRALSRDLVKRGFRFVGPTICYAFMQSVGLVNDHVVGCFRRGVVRRLAGPRTGAGRSRVSRPPRRPASAQGPGRSRG